MRPSSCCYLAGTASVAHRAWRSTPHRWRTALQGVVVPGFASASRRRCWSEYYCGAGSTWMFYCARACSTQFVDRHPTLEHTRIHTILWNEPASSSAPRAAFGAHAVQSTPRAASPSSRLAPRMCSGSLCGHTDLKTPLIARAAQCVALGGNWSAIWDPTSSARDARSAGPGLGGRSPAFLPAEPAKPPIRSRRDCSSLAPSCAQSIAVFCRGSKHPAHTAC